MLQVWCITECYLLAAAPGGTRLLLGSRGDEEHPARTSCLLGFDLSCHKGELQLTMLLCSALLETLSQQKRREMLI